MQQLWQSEGSSLEQGSSSEANQHCFILILNIIGNIHNQARVKNLQKYSKHSFVTSYQLSYHICIVQLFLLQKFHTN
jgi:hypothetical protein